MHHGRQLPFEINGQLTFLYLKPAVNHKPGFKVLIIIILQADKNYSRRSKNSPDFFLGGLVQQNASFKKNYETFFTFIANRRIN